MTNPYESPSRDPFAIDPDALVFGARPDWSVEAPPTSNPLRFILAMSRPYAGAAILATGAVTLATLLGIAVSYAFKAIVDAAAGINATGDTSTLSSTVLFYVGITFVSHITWRLSGFAGMRWAVGVRATSRNAITRYVMQHSHSYFAERFAGSIQSSIAHAANESRGLIEQFLWGVWGFIIQVIAGFVVVFHADVAIGLTFLAWVIVITPINYALASRRISYSRATQRAETAVVGASVDMLSNIGSVHDYARDAFERDRLKRLIARRFATGLRNWRYGENILLLNNVLQAAFFAGMMVALVHSVRGGSLTVGGIVFIISIIISMEDRLTFIGQKIHEVSDNWGVVKESLEDILVPHDVADRPGAKDLAVASGAVRFERMSFTYHGAPVFTDFVLDIPAGQRVGLVGRSGAGKSTLIKLLLRHYDLTGGRVTIDDADIAGVTKASLRRAIAVVPQEALLFHRSLRENIAYGRPDATAAEVEHAARQAQAHEFIITLPGGYDSLVGERGVKLSGGQRQRIAIARAFLKESPILLLDEATSALDSESEVAVQQALLTLMEGRTVIAIAHRLSTLRSMDRLVIIDQGRIVEEGTHRSLLAKKGLYAMLWKHQAGGFIAK